MKLLLIVAKANDWESNIVYRTIAYTEGEMTKVMWRGVFCTHKHGFLMSSCINQLAG